MIEVQRIDMLREGDQEFVDMGAVPRGNEFVVNSARVAHIGRQRKEDHDRVRRLQRQEDLGPTRKIITSSRDFAGSLTRSGR